ncbi:hypothetical protein [Sorangium sp. So ce693]|uniref:hypothetical protein n=1 Tax=Sorangium sp. So ce693 TaxID=3133318 RepID=UPI003F5DE755
MRNNNPFGPRPSTTKEATPAKEASSPELSPEARRFAAEPPVLLKMKVRKASRRAIKRAAAARGMTMKRYLLTLAHADGAAIEADDLKVQHEDEDDE